MDVLQQKMRMNAIAYKKLLIEGTKRRLSTATSFFPVRGFSYIWYDNTERVQNGPGAMDASQKNKASF